MAPKLQLCLLICLLLLLQSASACTSDSDCNAMNVCRHASCTHKNLFPLVWQEYIGSALIFLLIGMANATGLGGGPIMIPLLLTIFQFSSHEAVALSLTIAAVGSATAYLSKVRSRRPKSTKPLVDYDISVLMQPGLLLGTVYGVMLNQVCPPWLLLIMLTILLAYMCLTAFRKCGLCRGRKVFKQESAMKAASFTTNPSTLGFLNSESSVKTPEVPEPLFPPIQLAALLIVYAVALLYAFLAGGKNTASIIGITVCTRDYWLLFCGYSVACAVLIFVLGKLMLWRVRKDLAIGIGCAPGELRWSRKTVFAIVICGVLTGTVGGMFGIGGGMLIGPVLLSFDVDAQTTAATSIFMVLFSASNSVLQYIVVGVLNVDYALFFLVVAFLGSLNGVLVIKWLVEKFERSSIIIFLLAGIVGLAAVVVLTYNGVTIYHQVENNTFQAGFSSFCHR